MLAQVLLYAIVALALSVALVMLGSKAIAEKFVALGMLPRSFLGLVPVLKRAVRIVGVIMVVGGLVGISITNGWINPEILRRYGFPAALIIIGGILLAFTAKE